MYSNISPAVSRCPACFASSTGIFKPTPQNPPKQQQRQANGRNQQRCEETAAPRGDRTIQLAAAGAPQFPAEFALGLALTSPT